MVTPQQSTDVKKLTSAAIVIAFFAAFKFSKADATVTIKSVFEKMKAGFANLSAEVATPPTPQELVGYIFKILAAVANLTPSVTFQELEGLAFNIYTAVTGGSAVDFALIWNEVKDLLHGKLTGTLQVVDIEGDTQLLIDGFVGTFAFGLSKIKDANAAQIVDEVVADIAAGLDSIDENTPPTEQQALQGLYDLLDAIDDFWGNKPFDTVKNIFEKLAKLVFGNASSVQIWWELFVGGIQAKHALKNVKA